jgi:DNA-binding beta-propeller fold protein YncE
MTLGQTDEAGTDEKHFDKPTDMVVLPSGDIFVSDGYGNRRVVHFDKSGKFVKQWGREGSEPGQFACPHSIVADSKNRLYVADRDNARIQVFDTAGELLGVWDDLITPWGLYMTKNDEIWVSGSSRVKDDETKKWKVLPPPDQVVMKLNTKGKVLVHMPLQATETSPAEMGKFNWVHGIAADSQGNLYLSDIMGQHIQKFTRQP